MNDTAPDLIYLGSQSLPFNIPNGLQAIYDYDFWLTLKNKDIGSPFFTSNKYLSTNTDSQVLKFVSVKLDNLAENFILQKINMEWQSREGHSFK
jgi:hypothetical protein